MRICSLIKRKGAETVDKDFELIYETYKTDLYRFILSMTQNEDLALDILQDTMLKAASSLGKFRGECSVKTYLCAIARNEYRSWLKANRDRPLSMQEIGEPAAPDDVAKQAETRDLSMQIHGLLHRLEEPYKEVFLLRVFAELRFSEIGTLFGKSENWAGVTFFRAKKKLLAMMEEEKI